MSNSPNSNAILVLKCTARYDSGYYRTLHTDRQHLVYNDRKQTLFFSFFFRATLNRVNYEICACTESAIEGHTDEETPQGAHKAFVTSEL